MNFPSLGKRSEQKTKLFQRYPRTVHLHVCAGQEPRQVTDVGVSGEAAEGVEGAEEKKERTWVP